MHKIFVLILLPLLALLLLSGCSEENGQFTTNRVHPAPWSAPSNYLGTDFHGYEVLTTGNEDCKLCHGSDLLGSGVVPGCTDCHDNINGGHSSGWSDPLLHGAAAIDDFQRCKLCHGDDYLGGIVLSCDTCHMLLQWPHAPSTSWLNPASGNFHGDADLTSCTLCHGDDFLGGSTGVSCLSCHFDSSGSREPLGSGWTHDENNHEDYEAFSSVCNNCHNTWRTYEDPPINAPSPCHDCHGDGD